MKSHINSKFICRIQRKSLTFIYLYPYKTYLYLISNVSAFHFIPLIITSNFCKLNLQTSWNMLKKKSWTRSNNFYCFLVNFNSKMAERWNKQPFVTLSFGIWYARNSKKIELRNLKWKVVKEYERYFYYFFFVKCKA